MHEGIFVTRLEKIDGKTFDVQLEKLRKAAFKEDERVTEKTIFEIVPSDFRDKVAAELLATQNAEIAARTSHRDEQNAESVEKLAVTVK